MAKDINIHLKTRGTSQTKQELDQVGDSAKKVGEKAEHGGRKGADGINKLSDSAKKSEGSFGNFFKSIKSWAAGILGVTAIISGITRAINIQKQAVKEHADIIAEQQKKLLALMGMGTFFEQHPEVRKEVAAYAEYGRRPFEEVAGAWYGLESKGAGLTEQQKRGIMQEALELGRMEPEADLQSIIDVFSLYAKETRQRDINQVQNIIRQTLSQAGAELSQMGQYLPQFLSLGVAGGLTGAETAGLWAFATTRAPSPEKATVGIRNIFMALQGKGTPESQMLLEQLGITPQMNIFEQLTALSQSQKAGKFGVAKAETIAGKENAAILMSMLTEPQAMMETVRKITDVARPDIDITRQKLEQIMGTDKIARLEERRRQLGIEIENIKALDVGALEADIYFKKYERRMREAGVPEYVIKTQLWMEAQKVGIGLGPGAYRKWTTPWRYGSIRPEVNTPIIINDNKRIFNPVVGVNKEDLGVGPSAARGLQ